MVLEHACESDVVERHDELFGMDVDVGGVVGVVGEEEEGDEAVEGLFGCRHRDGLAGEGCFWDGDGTAIGLHDGDGVQRQCLEVGCVGNVFSDGEAEARFAGDGGPVEGPFDETVTRSLRG